MLKMFQGRIEMEEFNMFAGMCSIASFIFGIVTGAVGGTVISKKSGKQVMKGSANGRQEMNL